ncbi:hypothetical protein DY000_02006736 [Brassica cretica]|uniref:Uncharacterized protein n=1 Tax=Brassica cretica TaxID=69181 RepID=A0ABQ7C0M0_BRACR|nr:hypothetical protein DY000_02006736 [Brassica cretica]
MLHTAPTVDKKALPSNGEEFQFSLISKTWKSTGTRALPIYTSRSELEISGDFGAFWRYLEQAPEITIELDHRSIFEEEYRSMFTLEHRSTAKRAESPFGHSRLKAQVFTNLQDYP